MEKFLYKEDSLSPCILTSFYKVSNVLLRVSFAIKLQELGRLIPIWHSHVIDALCIGLRIHERTCRRTPYCARMVFIIMSCSCWTNIEAIEVECPCWEVPSPPFPLSTLVFSPFKVKPGGFSGPRLDSPESCNSSLFIRVTILTSFSSNAFVRRVTLVPFQPSFLPW